MLGATELLQNIAHLVENDYAHNFAFDHHNASLVVDGDATRVLQDVGTEFSHELTVLVVYLYLVCRGSLSDNDIARRANNSYSVRV